MHKLRQASKGIKLVKAVYPETQDQPIQNHQLDALMKYILINTPKVEDISKYIEKRIRKDLEKKRYGYIKVGMEIFTAIVSQTRSEAITFYGSSIINSLELLLNTPRSKVGEITDSLLSWAISTFEEFSKKYNNISEYHNMGNLVEAFVALALSSSMKERCLGCRGLLAFVTTVDDLDSFVARYIDIGAENSNRSRVIPAILNNIRSQSDEGVTPMSPPGSPLVGTMQPHQATVQELALSCLIQLSRSVSALTVQSLLRAVLHYFHETSQWMNESFVLKCIRAISQKVQQSSIIVSELLQYLDIVQSQETKIHVVRALVFLFDNTRTSVGPVVEVLFPLLRQLLSVSAQTTNDPDKPSVEQGLIKCIGHLGKRLTENSERIEAVTCVLDKMKTQSNPAKQALLLQALYELLANSNRSLTGAPHLILEFLPLTNHANPELRILALRTLSNLLTTPKRGSNIRDTEEKERSATIRKAVLEHLLYADNLPENFVLLFNVMKSMLTINGAREVEFSIPLIFKLEATTFGPQRESMNIQIGRALHTFAAAYLIHLSQTFGRVPELETYINEIMTDEWSRALAFKDGNLIEKKKIFKKSKKVSAPTKQLERERVVEFLCSVPLISQEFASRDLRGLLNLEHEDRTDSSVHLSASGTLSPESKKAFGALVQPRRHSVEKMLITADDFKRILQEPLPTPSPRNVPSSFDEWFSGLQTRSGMQNSMREVLNSPIEDPDLGIVNATCLFDLKYPSLQHAALFC